MDDNVRVVDRVFDIIEVLACSSAPMSLLRHLQGNRDEQEYGAPAALVHVCAAVCGETSGQYVFDRL